jgi:hypothetical protein
MRLMQLIVMSVIAPFVVMPIFADDVKPDPRENLNTAIPEAIRLLEAKEYKVFLKSFVIPEDFKRITATKSLEEFAKVFGERNGLKLLKVCKVIKDVKPTLDDTGTKATFAINQEIAGKKSITFVKVEKHWYIRN